MRGQEDEEDLGPTARPGSLELRMDWKCCRYGQGWFDLPVVMVRTSTLVASQNRQDVDEDRPVNEKTISECAADGHESRKQAGNNGIQAEISQLV